MDLRDQLGRPLADLRVSVTDRCNFRCAYCMPKEVFGRDFAFLPRSEILSFEEIQRIARLFVGRGVTKIRLTGGEPLLRRGIEHLVEMLRVDGPRELAMTTNGALLTRELARSLRSAGLDRISISLDAVDDATFRRINDVGFPVSRVLDAIDAAVDAGLTPVKVDVVIVRGRNDDQAVEIARRYRGTGVIVRFIEYMDVGSTNGWKMDDVVSGREIIERIAAEWPLVPMERRYRGEVAQRWKYADGSGEIGLITSVTQPFCGDCTRARLAADGVLYTCLFAGSGTDLRGPMREGADDETLGRLIDSVWSARADRYSEVRSEVTSHLTRVEMSRVGG